MAFGIGSLINNIAGTIANLLGKPNAAGYPEAVLGEVESQKNPKNWNKLPFPYTFSVSKENGESTAFTDFELPLAPSSIKQTEEPPTKIQSTQGGTVVSYSGNKYKSLMISGTTGLAPFRGTGGVNRDTGEAILQPAGRKYKSGYEVFIDLRNWFKAFYAYKNKYPDTNELLVFKNYKDGEFLVVELLSFEMNRNADRPFLYDYTINFKVLKHFKFSTPKKDIYTKFDEAINSAINKIDVARGIFLRTQGILRQIESTFENSFLEPVRKIVLAAKAFQGISTVAADMEKQSLQKGLTIASSIFIMRKLKDQQDEFNRTGITPSNPEVLEATIPEDIESAAKNDPAGLIIRQGAALLGIPTEEMPQNIQDAFEKEIAEQNLPRSFYEETIAELQRVKSNVEDFINLGSEDYDNLFNRTSTIEADVTKVATDDEFDILNAFNESITAIRQLLSTDDLFKSDYDDRLASLIQNFEDVSLEAKPAVRQIIMPANTNLEKLAQIELGDSARWVEIVELNDLKEPYVIQDLSENLPNVIHPGDKILIPENIINGLPEGSLGKENTTTQELTYLEKNLKTDLKLTNDFDLSLGNNNDLQLISGSENLGQSVAIKLSLEKGDLIKNPEIGVAAGIGSKMPPLAQLKDNLVTTLLQDERIEKVYNITVERQGPSVSMNFYLKVQQIDIPIPITIKV